MIGFSDDNLSFSEKLKRFPLFLFLLIVILCFIGLMMLYSAARGDFSRWASSQLVFFTLGFIVMIIVAFMPPTFIRMLAWPMYIGTLILLLLVMVMGVAGGGAERWIALGPVRIQPSEIAKYTTVVLLAHIAQSLDWDESRHIKNWLIPIMAVLSLFILTLIQPDMGTALLIAMVAITIIFLAGLHWWWYLLGIFSTPLIIIGAWKFVLKEYQKKRVETLLNPESDPLGSGYHIIQSKISFGSGGFFGKGFLNSTQGGLDYLPEKHTDFIFAVFGEEFGLKGEMLLIFLYMLIIFCCFVIAWRCRHQFGRILALGTATNFFLYMFINMGMVTGILPVVGVPLPLISKGGSALVVILFGFGLAMNAHIYRDVVIKKQLEF